MVRSWWWCVWVGCFLTFGGLEEKEAQAYSESRVDGEGTHCWTQLGNLVQNSGGEAGGGSVDCGGEERGTSQKTRKGGSI